MRETPKGVVIRVEGTTHGFLLPEGHELQERLAERNGADRVRLSVPGARGEVFLLLGTVEDGDEIVYHIKPQGLPHGIGDQLPGYPWRDLQNSEKKRLLDELNELQGRPFIDAWAAGATHEEHFAWLRSERRRLRGEADVD